MKDSQGNTLSEAQQVFFKNSVVRDGDGNLLVVYHGTDAEFTEKTEGRFSVLLDNQDNQGDHHRTPHDLYHTQQMKTYDTIGVQDKVEGRFVD